jgi:hypothetical protein
MSNPAPPRPMEAALTPPSNAGTITAAATAQTPTAAAITATITSGGVPGVAGGTRHPARKALR